MLVLFRALALFHPDGLSVFERHAELRFAFIFIAFAFDLADAADGILDAFDEKDAFDCVFLLFLIVPSVIPVIVPVIVKVGDEHLIVVHLVFGAAVETAVRDFHHLFIVGAVRAFYQDGIAAAVQEAVHKTHVIIEFGESGDSHVRGRFGLRRLFGGRFRSGPGVCPWIRRLILSGSGLRRLPRGLHRLDEHPRRRGADAVDIFA